MTVYLDMSCDQVSAHFNSIPHNLFGNLHSLTATDFLMFIALYLFILLIVRF